MYLITSLDPVTQRITLLSTHETASAAITAYAAAALNCSKLQVEASPGGYIDFEELSRRATAEAA